jgi:hypothetical protein
MLSGFDPLNPSYAAGYGRWKRGIAQVIFANMTKKRPRPVFTPSQEKAGTGWCVNVIWEDAIPEQIPGFQSESDVYDWIIHKSDAWLKGRKAT